jgi:CDP-glucose 4,6-dehydratase
LSEHLTTNQILDEIKNSFPTFSFSFEHFPQYHETEVLHLNSTKIRDALGWMPLFTTAESIEKTLTWYLSSEDKWLLTKNQVLEYIGRQELVIAK